MLTATEPVPAERFSALSSLRGSNRDQQRSSSRIRAIAQLSAPFGASIARRSTRQLIARSEWRCSFIRTALIRTSILNTTAIDTEDATCGGAATNNNVWGEGRLDAYAAVAASPREQSGTLTGTVVDGLTQAPIAAATIELDGPVVATIETDATGAIARNVEKAFAGIAEITTNIGAVTANAGETEQHAGTTLAAASGLSVQAKRLTEEVSAFMNTLHGGATAKAA